MAQNQDNTIILKVRLSDHRSVDVPVTPYTTCADVISFCAASAHQRPQDLILVELWRDVDRPLSFSERISEVLDQWGAHRDEVTFSVEVDGRHHGNDNMVNGLRPVGGHNGMRDSPSPTDMLPSGVDLTLSELQEMAARQHQKIDQQHQLLVAKEQRLKFLKQQEQKHQAAAGQTDRLKRMRNRVEVLEAKLRKIRAQRGDAMQEVDANATLATELEQVKSVFREKEAELATAVSRVDALHQQLDETRTGKSAPTSTGTNTDETGELAELERLRKELAMRNKLNEQQNAKMASHHDVLQQRKSELMDLDKRVAELKLRIRKKKEPSPDSTTGSTGNIKSSPPVSSNVVAVEPYKHAAPSKTDDDTSSGGPTKSDPKYQTLPHSLKFKMDTTDAKMNKDQATSSSTSSIYDGLKSRKAFFENNNDGKKEAPKENNLAEDGAPRKAQPPSYHSVMGLAAQQGSQSLYSRRDMPPPPSTATDTTATSWPETTPSTRISHLMTNFAPRPYGSTFSTSGSGSRPTTVTSPSSSILSSPMSSGVKPEPKTSTPVSANHIDKGDIYGSSTGYNKSASQTSIPVINVSTQGTKDIKGPSGPNQNGTKSSSAMARLMPNVGASQNLSSSSSSSSLSSSSSAAPLPPSSSSSKPMYASKSVIANTYMRRLSPNALDQYRKSMNQIYQGFTPSAVKQEGDKPGENPTARVRPMNVDMNESDVPHNIEKFRPHAPRVHRRRSSSGDSPENPYRATQTRTNSRSASEDEVFSNDVPDGAKIISPTPDLLKDQPQKDASQQKDRNERLPLVLRRKKTNLKNKDSVKNSRRVSFDPLALLLDASLEGELELVKKSAQEVPDPSCPNDEGITALHNAICAGHYEIVKFLVEYGCNVNAPDSDGWTPLHCAASCNNLPMVQVLVEHGACIFATTISDQETAAEKCEEDEDGYDGCSEYLYNIQEKLGSMNDGDIFAVFDYAAQNADELHFVTGDKLRVLRKGDDSEQEWWWAKHSNREGYVPRNLFGLFPRTRPQWLKD